MTTVRGTTTVTDRAIARIAAHATGGSAAMATVERGGVLAWVAVAMPYPVPIGPAADRMRQEIATRVRQMTGLPVHQVDIEVTELEPDR
ncbi:hypothetical protein DPM19_08625 [Actinomadura craniellae]|uniref:Asp23/Gls24 family envelope stress response protein n=1 Tax=Actinomadura craniellae TaxID=2231787 RepID=A0A365H9R4_9ACTN|nr:Asp23/Gls24 family envelope stress response protein [Actinomadura craniellae]RAY15821.1 hypothetical protein DPM19_08625 [Actinomadura craniellae]